MGDQLITFTRVLGAAQGMSGIRLRHVARPTSNARRMALAGRRRCKNVPVKGRRNDMASFRPLMIAASVALGLSSVARADDASTTQDLAAQVKALQAKVDSLEGKSAASQAEVSATI